MTIRDPIVEEVRELRRKTKEACGGDGDRLAHHYRAVATGDHAILRGSPKRLTILPPTGDDKDRPR